MPAGAAGKKIDAKLKINDEKTEGLFYLFTLRRKRPKRKSHKHFQAKRFAKVAMVTQPQF